MYKNSDITLKITAGYRVTLIQENVNDC